MTEESALNVGELELFVNSMEPTQIENIGHQGWIDWHIRLQKLNQQAVLEANSIHEEQTKEALISHGKLPVLVWEAICIQVWRSKILPYVMKLNPKPQSTFSTYMVLYHEASAVGLLETVLFHDDAASCLVEVLLDLLDYTIEMVTALITLVNDGYLNKESTTESEDMFQELERQQSDLKFDIGMRCISIIRYIGDHMEIGGSAVIGCLYRKHDVIMLFTHLLELQPWRRSKNGEVESFIYGRWSKDDQSKLHQTEAQLWLGVRQLLLDQRMSGYYNIDNVRRDHLCKLQAHLTEKILDQIPPLTELKMLLCRLSVGDFSGLASPGQRTKEPGALLIEVVPQIKKYYLEKVHKRCKALAKEHLRHMSVDPENKESCDIAKRLVSCYTSDAALSMDGGGAKCANCGDPAANKCSRCKTEWYCGRECQVKCWAKHKELCDQLSQLII